MQIKKEKHNLYKSICLKYRHMVDCGEYCENIKCLEKIFGSGINKENEMLNNLKKIIELEKIYSEILITEAINDAANVIFKDKKKQKKFKKQGKPTENNFIKLSF